MMKNQIMGVGPNRLARCDQTMFSLINKFIKG
jgi:hypothetical protein